MFRMSGLMSYVTVICGSLAFAFTL